MIRTFRSRNFIKSVYESAQSQILCTRRSREFKSFFYLYLQTFDSKRSQFYINIQQLFQIIGNYFTIDQLQTIILRRFFLILDFEQFFLKSLIDQSVKQALIFYRILNISFVNNDRSDQGFFPISSNLNIRTTCEFQIKQLSCSMENISKHSIVHFILQFFRLSNTQNIFIIEALSASQVSIEESRSYQTRLI